jgi:hypothetical protein
MEPVDMIKFHSRVWAARVLIGLVMIFNIQCAVVFLAWPDKFAPGFQLSGDVGTGVVRGFGLLFLMWNVPYVFACYHPTRNKISLFEAVVMQTIGLAGEILLLVTFPNGNDGLAETISRFIIFDSFGLLALCLAAWITRRPLFPDQRSALINNQM